MTELNPYTILKMEFPSIKSTIISYTNSDIILNYLDIIEKSLKTTDVSKLMYALDKVCNWYGKNLTAIRENSFVYNYDEHVEVYNMLVDLSKKIGDMDFTDIPIKEQKNIVKGNKVFIVHGHDNEAKITIARTLEQLGLEAIILHEQADKGKTIIEKLESFVSQAAYAIILYTECDVGRSKTQDESSNRNRARQNVVFEHGLFIGALGRNNVCALVKGNIEKPGDIDGVVYVPMDEAGAWKMQLCKNMKSAGLDVDLNKLI